jgi:hypothetical protein
MFSFKLKAIYDVFSDPIFTFLLFFLTHMAHANIYAFQSAYVRRVKGLLGLSLLGLISRLRGQVKPLLYIMR